ncbi:MAG: hypothetical protein AAF458_15920 [Pseudomonadota bacterium]
MNRLADTMAWKPILSVLLPVLLLATPALTVAQEFGRLFSSVQQRADLDSLRQKYDPNRQEIIYKEGPKTVVAPAKAAPKLPDLMVNGLIIRSGGRSSAWVNGTPLTDGEATPDGVQIRSGASGIQFVLPSGDNTATIRPGQMLDPNAGTVQDNLVRLEAERRAQLEAEIQSARSRTTDGDSATAEAEKQRSERQTAPTTQRPLAPGSLERPGR